MDFKRIQENWIDFMKNKINQESLKNSKKFNRNQRIQGEFKRI